MKRTRVVGFCAHVTSELSAVEFGNLLQCNGKAQRSGQETRNPVPASHACCGCGQYIYSGGMPSGAEKTVNGSLRGCACGSTLLLDIARSELYCCSCRDYVYLPTFDQGRQLSHVAQRYVGRGLSPGLPPHDPGSEVRSKRARAARDPALAALRREVAADLARRSGSCTAAAGSGAEAAGSGAGGPRRQYDGSLTGPSTDIAPDGFPAGLRGLNNLGNTCFMNSVLQVFIHSPLMRNYFLGQGHTQAACTGHGRTDGRPCLSCEMDAVFAAAYSGDRAPLSPTDFLYSWWTFADSLAGYQQQDAHEFYLSALSGLASAMITPPPPPLPSSPPSPPPPLGKAGCAHATSPKEAGPAGLGGAAGIKKEEGEEAGAAAAGSVAASAKQQAGTAAKDESPTRRSTEPLYDAVRHPTGGHAMGAANAGGEGGDCAAARRPHSDPSGAASDGDAGGPRSLSLVDMVFGGLLRSDVTCAVCGYTSTAYDPFLDISLDMVAFGALPSQMALLPTGAGAPPWRGDTPPVTSLALAHHPPGPGATGQAGEGDMDTDTGDGASKRQQVAGAAATALAGPSASACGGRSSQSASPTRSLSGSGPPTGTTTGTGTGAGVEETGEGEEGEDEGEEGRERQRRRRRLWQSRDGVVMRPAASPSASTSSGSGPAGDEAPRRGGQGGGKAKLRVISVLTSASEDSCGPVRPSGGSAVAADADPDQLMRDADTGTDAAATPGAGAPQALRDADSPGAHAAPAPAAMGRKGGAASTACGLAGRRAPTPCTADAPGPEGGHRPTQARAAVPGACGPVPRGSGTGGRRTAGGRAGPHPADRAADAVAENPATAAEAGRLRRSLRGAGGDEGAGPGPGTTLMRANSDSVAAAESAADGGGGGSPELVVLAAEVAPDECITSPRATAVMGASRASGGRQQPQLGDAAGSPLPPSPSAGAQPSALDLIVLTSSPSDADCGATASAQQPDRQAPNAKRGPAPGAARATGAPDCAGTGAVQGELDPPVLGGGPSADAGCEQGSRGVTPGASAAEGEGEREGEEETIATEAAGALMDDDADASLQQQQQQLAAATSHDKDQELGSAVVTATAARLAAGRGRGLGVGRAPRGRGRGGGRGRRGGQGGRGGPSGGRAAVGGGSSAQMDQPGASAEEMVDARLTRRPAARDTGAAGAAVTAGAGVSTLLGCLRHFVTPERLSASEASWVCAACQRRQPAVKQLSIRRLPPVLALHVKRFEQRGHHHHHHHHHHPHQHLQHQHDVTHQKQPEAGTAAAGAPGGTPGVGLYGMGPAGQEHGHAATASTARPGRHAARKLQTPLQFPLSLDLTPYTTSSILRDRYGMRPGQGPPGSGGPVHAAPTADMPAAGKLGEVSPAVDGAALATSPDGGSGGDNGSGDNGSVQPYPSPHPSCQYRLFAVISHKGDLSGGHYVVFVRPSSGGGGGGAGSDGTGGGGGGGWYQCDDAWVTAVTEEDVTACQAYMLFYSSAAGWGSGGAGNGGRGRDGGAKGAAGGGGCGGGDAAEAWG